MQTCEETLGKALGSCRDTGWLLVQILRHLGLAARFVSGYLVQLTADVKALDGPSGPTADFTDLHAWAEVYVPGRRLDRARSHLRSVRRRGAHSARLHARSRRAPRRSPALAEPAEVDFSLRESRCGASTRIRASPSRTPTSSGQAIDALGHAIDADLAAHDVRLTMGGEPTFVLDRRHGRRGVEHRCRSGRPSAGSPAICCGACTQRFAPGGAAALRAGQVVSRASRCRAGRCRASGAPTAGRSGTTRACSPTRRSHDGTTADARARASSRRWRCGSASPPELAIPGYEDAFYYLWKEGTLPVNVDPLRGDLDDPAERRRLADAADARSRHRHRLRPAAALAPIAAATRGGWQSSRWVFRRARMYLVPGDSPMGYRLPLDSLPWVPPEQRDTHSDRSLLRAACRRSATFTARWPSRYSRAAPAAVVRGFAGASARAADVRDGAWRMRCAPRSASSRATAGCYVFLPPLTHLEHYLDLLACIEATAARAAHAGA